jgi:hypothetical protein
MRYCIAIIFFLILSLNAKGQRGQQIMEIRARIAEIDSLINCEDSRGRIADSWFHASIIGGTHRRVLGMRFPVLHSGGGGQTTYFRYRNCPDSIVAQRWWECDEWENVYFWRGWVQQHKITRKTKRTATFRYYKDGEKVATIEWVDHNWMIRPPRKTTRFYNEGIVIYRNRTRKRR